MIIDIAKINELIKQYQTEINLEEAGIVTRVNDGVINISGLSNATSNELLYLNDGVQAMVLNINPDSIDAVVFSNFESVKAGDIAVRSKNQISVPVGEELLGRVLNPLGQPIDGLGSLETEKYRPIESKTPPVIVRESVSQPLLTGIKAIDAFTPIGRGQRQLIIGDRQTGKTSVAIDTILNQKDVICIYVAIGQKDSKTASLVRVLKESDAIEHTIVIAAGASNASPLKYIAPYSGTAMAEYFAEKGKDVLVIYDDLSKHASAYREMSLLLRRPPGREAFPGDVFYIHSRLLERAVKYNHDNGGGSITALPIIETQAGDVSSYIPTNVISITDGQLFLNKDLFNKGIRPAIDVGLSVSRVGSAAQNKNMKKVAGKLRIKHAQYRELKSFAEFSSDLDEITLKAIETGKRIDEILKQKNKSPQPLADQVIEIYAVSNNFFSGRQIEEVNNAAKELSQFIKNTSKELYQQLNEGKWTDEVISELEENINQYLAG